MNINKMKHLVVLVLTVFALSAFSQDINQAGEFLNAGNQALKANDFTTALEKYNQCIDVASTLGEEGEMMVVNAQSQIPSLYYKIGVGDYKEKKIEKAILEFEKAIEYGEKYSDPETAKKAAETIPKLYYSQGNTFYSNKQYDEALTSFQKAAEIAPEYSRAFWGMGLAYNKLKDTKNMKESFETALKLAEADGDEKMITKISKNAKKILQAKGAKKLQSQDWDGALVCLNASLTFDPKNADTYYYIALANNGLKKWDVALNAAETGVTMSTDQNTEYLAKFYYEKGNALKGSGQNTKACEAYTNAKHGRFVESAEYELTTVLKCK